MADYLHDLWIYFEAVFLPELATLETEWFAVAALSTCITLVVLLWCLLRKTKRGKYVCLLGLSNSGKTLIFMQLIYKQFRHTQVSIKENKATYTPTNKSTEPCVLVDVAGDERVRNTIFKKYKTSLRSVVVVVDSDNFPQEVRSVAQLLYDLLSDEKVGRAKVPLLVACNKQDMPLAQSCADVQEQLEREITALRVSRSAQLTAHEDRGTTRKYFLGNKGKDFEFRDVSCPVNFIPCSARGKTEDDQPQLGGVVSWIG